MKTSSSEIVIKTPRKNFVGTKKVMQLENNYDYLYFLYNSTSHMSNI